MARALRRNPSEGAGETISSMGATELTPLRKGVSPAPLVHLADGKRMGEDAGPTLGGRKGLSGGVPL